MDIGTVASLSAGLVLLGWRSVVVWLHVWLLNWELLFANNTSFSGDIELSINEISWGSNVSNISWGSDVVKTKIKIGGDIDFGHGWLGWLSNVTGNDDGSHKGSNGGLHVS